MRRDICVASSVRPPIPATSSQVEGNGSGEAVEKEAMGTGGDEDIVEEQDVEPRRIVPSPIRLSASQVAAHRVTHHPYRSWCDECVEAFGREKAHFGGDHASERKVPLISMD